VIRSGQRRVGRCSVAALAALCLTACGIDQGGFDGGPPDLPQLTLVSGPITGFGSVHVNGLVLDTAGTQILIDGVPGVESELRVGQVIRALAMVEHGTGRALSIEHRPSLVGPINALDAATGALTVLGQHVLTNTATRLDGAPLGALANLSVAMPVVVSGIRMPSGAILATYVGRAAPTDHFKITASITSVDHAALTFELAGLTVDYSQVVLLEVPSGMPELGAVVDVSGAVLVGDRLRAEHVRALPLLPGSFNAADTALTSAEAPLVNAPSASAGLAANFIGFVTASRLPGAISLLDVEVTLGAGTLVIGGTTNDLVVGRQVRVEGRITGSGAIQADRILIL
jgi:hypothetical protein